MKVIIDTDHEEATNDVLHLEYHPIFSKPETLGYIQCTGLDADRVTVTSDGDFHKAYVGIDETFKISVGEYYMEDASKYVSIELQDPTGGKASVTVKDMQSDLFTITYLPELTGVYILSVKVYGCNIAGSPYHIMVMDKNSPHGSGQDEVTVKGPPRVTRSSIDSINKFLTSPKTLTKQDKCDITTSSQPMVMRSVSMAEIKLTKNLPHRKVHGFEDDGFADDNRQRDEVDDKLKNRHRSEINKGNVGFKNWNQEQFSLWDKKEVDRRESLPLPVNSDKADSIKPNVKLVGERTGWKFGKNHEKLQAEKEKNEQKCKGNECNQSARKIDLCQTPVNRCTSQKVVAPPVSKMNQVAPPVSKVNQVVAPPVSKVNQVVAPPVSKVNQVVAPPVSKVNQVAPPVSNANQVVSQVAPPVSKVSQVVTPPVSKVERKIVLDQNNKENHLAVKIKNKGDFDDERNVKMNKKEIKLTIKCPPLTKEKCMSPTKDKVVPERTVSQDVNNNEDKSHMAGVDGGKPLQWSAVGRGRRLRNSSSDPGTPATPKSPPFWSKAAQIVESKLATTASVSLSANKEQNNIVPTEITGSHSSHIESTTCSHSSLKEGDGTVKTPPFSPVSTAAKDVFPKDDYLTSGKCWEDGHLVLERENRKCPYMFYRHSPKLLSTYSKRYLFVALSFCINNFCYKMYLD